MSFRAQLVSSVRATLRRVLGLEVRRRYRPRALRRFDPRGRFNIGAGEDQPVGYIHCDVRAVPGIDLVCRAWDLSLFTQEAEEIYSRHTLEHLTLAEVRRTVADWFAALRVGGRVRIIVPDMEFHIAQWQRAEWTEAALAEKWSDARHSLAGFYGWQREAGPGAPDAPYTPTYWDVHKCGFGSALLRLLLESAGFARVRTTRDGPHLVAEAEKVTRAQERQVAPSVSGIREDHVMRYRFAAEHIPAAARVLDAACGVGYGAKIIAEAVDGAQVSAVDVDPGALAYAREFYAHPRIRFVEADLSGWQAVDGGFEAVVSFETIEHLEDPRLFLRTVRDSLVAGGLLLCSSPDGDRCPYDPDVYRYHTRHYTEAELRRLLTDCGFVDVEVFGQVRDDPGIPIADTTRGEFLILKARVPRAPGSSLERTGGAEAFG